MKILINIVKFIMMLILTLCIIFIGIKNIAYSTILSKEYVLQQLDDTDFYSGTYELVKSGFENYISQSGLDEVVLDNICTEEKVKNDISIILSNIYEGTNKEIDTSEIADSLNSNIDKLNVRTSANQSSIDKFVEQICDEYKSTIINTKYENSINSKYTELTNLINKIEKIVLALMIISIIVLIVLNIKNIYKLIGNIGTVLLATSFVFIAIVKTINSKVNISGIKIFNDVFSNSVVTILKDILNKINNMGITILVISIFIILIYVIYFCIASKKDNKKIDEEE